MGFSSPSSDCANFPFNSVLNASYRNLMQNNLNRNLHSNNAFSFVNTQKFPLINSINKNNYINPLMRSNPQTLAIFLAFAAQQQNQWKQQAARQQANVALQYFCGGFSAENKDFSKKNQQSKLRNNEKSLGKCSKINKRHVLIYFVV